MQLHKTMRLAGVTLSAAALALLTAEGTAAAHERMSSPDLRGRVTSVASGDFVIQKYDGTTQTVDTTDTTTYSEPGTAIAPPGVYDGENVAVTLDPTASSPTATNVDVFPERVGGSVSNVSGSAVTLTNKRGTDTVIVSPSTKYSQKGATPTGVGDGEAVTVFGLPDASTPGDLDAQIVTIFSPAAQPQPPAPQTTQPQPTTTADTQWPHAGTPAAQPAAAHAPSTTGWSAPSAPSAPHGSFGGPGRAGAPGPRGGGNPVGFGGQGFGHN